MAQRTEWKKMGCKEYICPHCKRNKGMIYLFPDKNLRYVCFCGANVSIGWIKENYNFEKKSFLKTAKPSYKKDSESRGKK